MKYVLYVAGMPFDGNTLSEGKSLGGSETMGYYVARDLAKRGHEVVIFTDKPFDKATKIDNVVYLPIGKRTKEAQYGEYFEDFAKHVPHDVLLIQRAPAIFSKNFNSKVNLWWTHDLALLRGKPSYESQLPFVDSILCVSEFHKKQILGVYGHKEEYIDILPNAVDQDLFKHQVDPITKISSKTMIYSSRPERGLENLVMPGGIMDKLYSVDPEIKLIVCGYDNTTQQMEGYYNQLWDFCRQLPNVELFEPQSKTNLANIMLGAWLHIYPTEFEETSCITAMEETCAGTPFLTTRTGALTETLKDSGVYWVDKDKDGRVDIEGFVKAVESLQNVDKWKRLHEKCVSKSSQFHVDKSVDKLEEIVEGIFKKKNSCNKRLAKHLIKNSDIIAAKKLIEKDPENLKEYNDFIEKEYKSVFSNDPKDFYDNIADYNTNQIGNTHNLGNDQYQLSMPRIKPALQFLNTVKPGSTVLDYGCCVGQVTVAYARMFPQLNFVGCDIAKGQTDIGAKYVEDKKIKNVEFINANHPSEIDRKFDAVLCSEVLEHVEDYRSFLSSLENLVSDGSPCLISVPSGPHEEVRWGSQTVREHLHHFEESDVKEIFKDRELQLLFTPSHSNKHGECLGNYSIIWDANHKEFGAIDYERKFKYQSPVETISACIISRPDGLTLGKTLDSIKDIVDEIIIGFDGEEGVGKGWEIAKDFNAKAFKIESPLIQGFDAARNQTIDKATSDWIMWIDDDETFIWSHQLAPMLRNNQYDSYAIHQHHFSAEPAGLMKTDLPCRIFRNHLGMKFLGMVHEHPELEMNKGAGETALLPSNLVAICHNGYENEEIRRNRFLRNWPLMQKDIQKNPDRELGQFLFIRDLMHLNRFEIERNSGRITHEMIERCNKALLYFVKLIDNSKLRLVVDCLPYISEASKMLSGDQAFEVEFSFRTRHMGIGDDLNKAPSDFVQALLPNKELGLKLMNLVAQDKLEQFDQQYI